MNSRAEGYLVVQRVGTDVRRGYRGIHRIPPFSQEKFDQGFDDPYLSDELDETGLLSTLELAEKFVWKYRDIYRPGELEIIFVSTGDGTPPLGTHFMGFDVADSKPPFYSLIGDAPSDVDINTLLRRLNQYGLFSDSDDAKRYIELTGRFLHSDHPVPVIWKVYLVNST